MRRSASWLAVVMVGLLICIQPASAQNFVEERDYWFKPAIFPGKADLSRHPYGPQKAKGLVIWNHGYNPSKMAPEKVPPVMQYFAEAGWDAYHLQRHSIIGVPRGGAGSGSSQDNTAPLILHVLEASAISLSYQRIVLMGQSRGAFAVIQVGSYNPRITGILPLSPAAYGDYGRSTDWRQNDFHIRSLWDSFKDSKIRVAAGFFTGDDWYETKLPHVRGPFARQRLSELGVENFIIDQPDYPKMQGHGGGQSWQFARRYGACLEHFFLTGKSPSCSEQDSATAGVFGIRLPKLPVAEGYAGLWQATWADGRFTALTIDPPQDGKHHARYMRGLGVNGDKADTTTMSLVRQDDMLVREILSPINAGWRFRLLPDDRLEANWTAASGNGGSTTVFRRARRS